eukprot:8032306-Alexandrium_andersonii.AAC.1
MQGVNEKQCKRASGSGRTKRARGLEGPRERKTWRDQESERSGGAEKARDLEGESERSGGTKRAIDLERAGKAIEIWKHQKLNSEGDSTSGRGEGSRAGICPRRRPAQLQLGASWRLPACRRPPASS